MVRLERQGSRVYLMCYTLGMERSYSVGCFGCATSLIGLILVVFIVTHVSEIFAKLATLVK
jgi:hypothetical protein